MELKSGYKQTEVGVIPEDWDCVHIGDVAETSSGATPSRAKQQDYFDGGTIPWVKTLDLNNSSILETDECITLSALQQTSLRLYPSGSVLVAMYGGFNQIGRTGMLTKKATINQALTAIRPDPSRLSSKFLLNYLNFRVEYWKSVASSSRKDPNITGRDVREFPIALPPLREQEAAGEALQDIEDQIFMLGELIAKKTEIKQAAMQELLTGKRRLPGFEGEWETVAISQIAERITGFWGRTEPGNEAIYSTNVIRAGDISEDGRLIGAACRYLSHHEISVAGCRSGDTVMTASGNGLGKSWTCSQDGVYSASNFVRIIRPLRGKADGHFIGYALKSRRSRSKLIEHTATSAYPNLKPSFFNDSWLPLPPEAEQKAISRVLQDIDIEILELEARKLKASQFKQGMMQQLLTGKIRLK